ncbi:hypothetical protein BH10BDE1_BH10BDE1_00310 [soil metagenome]
MSSKSKFSYSYVAMGIVAVFAGWVYVHEFKGGQERDKETLEAAALLPFSNDKVISVRLYALTQNAPVTDVRHETVLKKDGDTWKVEKPYADLADATAVDSFLATLSTEKIGEVVVEAPDIAWKTYGLDSPSAEGDFLAKVDGIEKKRTIKVGSVPAFDGSVYVRLDAANRVVLMSSTTLAALQKDPRDFRDKRFFPAAKHPEFSELELTRVGAPKIHFFLKDGVWHEAESKSDAKSLLWPLDQVAVKTFVQSVAGLRGNDVWAENKLDTKVIKQRGLNKPGLLIRLSSAGAKEPGPIYEARIASLEKSEQVAAGVSSARPLVFSVFKASIDSLSKSIDTFRDLKFPFQYKIADAHAVELERPRGEVSLPILVRKDGKWLIDPMDPNFHKRDLKPGTVEKLLVDLDALSAKQLMPMGTTKPKLGAKGSLRVGLFEAKNKKLVEFIFEPVGEAMHVSSSKIPGRVFSFEKAAFDSLSFDLVADAPASPSPPPEPSPASKGTP